MRPAIRLLNSQGFPSFFKRSLDEFSRLSRIATKFQGIRGPDHSMPMWKFDSPESVVACTSMSDQDIGGSSMANVQFVPATSDEPSHVLFSGDISNDLPSDDMGVERTGYAAFRTKDRPRTLFGKGLWDVDVYEYLALRIKSDGRKYKVNVQTESIVYSDIHQHRIYAKNPGQWETVMIKWNDFVRTNHGIIVEPQSEILKEKIRTIGFGLTDRVAGPFEMRVADMWTTNGYTDEESAELAKKSNYVPKEFSRIAPSQPSQRLAR